MTNHYLDLKKGSAIFGDEIIEIDRYFCQTSYDNEDNLKKNITKEYIRHVLWVDDLRYYLVYHNNTISEKFLSFSKINKRRKNHETHK